MAKSYKHILTKIITEERERRT